MDDYSKYPKSLTEIKSDKEGNGSLWSPRDVLIDALRDIDNGKINPQALVVVHSEINDNGMTDTKWAQSGPNIIFSIGMLSYAIHRMMILGDTGNE